MFSDFVSGAVTIVVIIVLTLVQWFRRTYSFWQNTGAPSEPASLLFGNIKTIGTTDHAGSCMQKIYEKFKKQKVPFVGIYFFTRPVALLVDIDLVKNVLIKDYSYFQNRGVFINEQSEPISGHMFALHGERWKQLRSKLSPTFTSGRIKIMFPMIVTIAKKLEAKIDKISCEGKELNMKQLMARFTIDVIGTCIFRLDCNSLENPDTEFYRVGIRVLSDPGHSVLYDLFLLIYRDWAQKLGLKRFRDETSEFYTGIMKKIVDYRTSSGVRHNDFVDLLIDLYQSDGADRITFNGLVAQAFIFFVAGFETSSTTLQFCFYELAKNPDIQEKARKHIDEVLARHDGEFTYEAMMDMKYIDQIVNETLRLYPPVVNLFRTPDRDYRVSGTKFVFKKDMTVVIPAFAIQRDPEFYPDPLRFNPDHFTEEKVKTRPSVAFLPFGEGPRFCIGARFGSMQTRIGLITALRNYRYSLSPRTKDPIEFSKDSFVISPADGIWLNVKPV